MYIKTVCAVQFWNQYSVFYDPFTAAKSWPNLTAYEADISHKALSISSQSNRGP